MSTVVNTRVNSRVNKRENKISKEEEEARARAPTPASSTSPKIFVVQRQERQERHGVWFQGDQEEEVAALIKIHGAEGVEAAVARLSQPWLSRVRRTLEQAPRVVSSSPISRAERIDRHIEDVIETVARRNGVVVDVPAVEVLPEDGDVAILVKEA